MEQAKPGKRVPILLVVGLLGAVLVVGCYRMAPDSLTWNRSGSWAGAGGPGGADPFAAGKKVFGANCARCHSVGGDSRTRPAGGAQDRMKGPDLSHVGADPGHTRQWLMDYVRDPQGENRVSRMPKFEGRLSTGDLLALADYLASLKGN
jgi:mono/diheme cytochrome c family protein